MIAGTSKKEVVAHTVDGDLKKRCGREVSLLCMAEDLAITESKTMVDEGAGGRIGPIYWV